jgi:hypothetical protein
MRAAKVIMLIAALLIAASLQSSPLASSNWHVKTSSRDLAVAVGGSCKVSLDCRCGYCSNGTCKSAGLTYSMLNIYSASGRCKNCAKSSALLKNDSS